MWCQIKQHIARAFVAALLINLALVALGFLSNPSVEEGSVIGLVSKILFARGGAVTYLLVGSGTQVIHMVVWLVSSILFYTGLALAVWCSVERLRNSTVSKS